MEYNELYKKSKQELIDIIDSLDEQLDNKYIYVITTFSKVSKDEHGFPDYGGMRTVAWFSSYDDAYESISNNNCDIWEYCYDYAVLETLPEGMYPSVCNGYEREYFKYDKSQNKYQPIDITEVEFDGYLQCWSIG